MTVTPDLQALLHAEQLDKAIEYLNGEVRTHPTAIDRRAQLAEVLCIAGNLERADTVLNAITDLDPGAMVGVALFRQLVRAEQARQQFYSEGRLPEFVAKPDLVVELELQAAIAVRTGAFQDLTTLIERRDAERIPLTGMANGEPFQEFRDLDDLSAAHLEVFTATGKYFWIPYSTIESIELRKPASRRDLLWRRALVAVTDGPDGEVFIPSIYRSRGMTTAERLGHTTDFEDVGARVALGRGLRTFLIGEFTKTIHEIDKIRFSGHG